LNSRHSPGRWIGRALPRFEDDALLTGAGRFTDDVSLPGEVFAAFVRSPHAHARIAGIDAGAALAAPGALAVFTGRDVMEEKLQPVPFARIHKRPDGSEITMPPRHALTPDVARFAGDAVAMVVASTRSQALDAAELVEVDWDPLPAVADLARAASAAAPAVWAPAFTAEHGNIAALYRNGERAAVEEAFAKAAHLVSLRLVNQRVVANPLEPRSILASHAAGRFTVHTPSQNVHQARAQLSAMFGLPEDRFHVLCGHVGGGFGTRGYVYPEHAALCLASRRLGRPVKWTAWRSENFLSEVHGRDNISTAELALDAEHRFLALRIVTLANCGAYASNFGTAVPALSGARAATGVYAIPLLDHEVRIILTNTVPVDAYRGAGRPEIGYLLERLVARAAAQLGVDPVWLRAKNMVSAAQMPYRNAAGSTCDTGDFGMILRVALREADWTGLDARRAQARQRGRFYGGGIGAYVEVSGGARLTERVPMAVDADGTVTAVSGVMGIGQGISTAFAQIVAETLGVAPRQVRVVCGDSDRVDTGGGAGGSRGLQVGGSAMLAAARAMVEAGRRLAATELEAAEADVAFEGGRFRIAGTDRGIGLFELAGRQPGGRIECVETTTVPAQTWPNGAQVCEVEVDPETGLVRVARMTAVDDVGNVINPLIAEGQVQGGIAQGVGQALLEHSVYDEEGQLLTGSFMDYAMPRADLLPELRTRFDPSFPTQLNPLGAKGAGEAGCHGATPAVVNAVLDALREFGVKELDMPLTPEKVWRAMQCGPQMEGMP